MTDLNRTKTKFSKFAPLVVGSTMSSDTECFIVTWAGPVRKAGQGYSQDYTLRPATAEEWAAAKERKSAAEAAAADKSAQLLNRADASGNY